MSVDKKVNYDVQGGVKNYLGKQKEVKAPLKWKSSPDNPETELAYITKAEKDLLVKQDLHGSLQGGVNRGPSGIMSLDGYGSFDSDDPGKDTGMSGAATSAAETGSTSTSDIKDVQAQMGQTNLPPGVMPQQAQDYQLAAIAAGAGQKVNPGFFDDRNTVSPSQLAAAKAFNPTAFKKNRKGGIMDFITSGGFLGSIVRNVGQRFGLGKKYNEPTYDMSGINTRVYENIPGVSTNPNYYNDLDNELMLSPELDEFDADTFDDQVNLNNVASLIEASKKMPENLGGMSTDSYPVQGIEKLMTPEELAIALADEEI
jgi:hypothetical protein